MKIYSIKKAKKDYPDDNIKKGDSYFYCRPKGLGKIRSRYKPSLEEWIQDYIKSFRGEFATNMAEWEIKFTELTDNQEKEDLLEEIDEFISQKEDSLANIPDSLQDSSIINEQLDELRSFREDVDSWEGWDNDWEDDTYED